MPDFLIIKISGFDLQILSMIILKVYTIMDTLITSSIILYYL